MSRLILGPLIGGLSSDQAYLWARANSPGTLYAWLSLKSDMSDAWFAGMSLPLRPEDGFAGVVPLKDLTPLTRYTYSLSLSNTPPRPRPDRHPHFTTFPEPEAQQSFAFAFGSCFLPETPEGGGIFNAIDEFRTSDNLAFLLMIGDQIYADDFAHNGIGKVASNLQEYRDVYEYTWSRLPLRKLLANLPVFMTLDDHEVDDDWRWIDSSRQWATIPWWDKMIRWLKGRPPQEREIPLKRVQDALQAYWEHQGMHAPTMRRPPEINRAGQYELAPEAPGSLAYSFDYGAAAFFILDTRTMRIRNRTQRSMLGEGQWQSLENWLLRVKDSHPVKFLVSSCALLYDMLLDVPADRWSGFPHERRRLLNFLAAHGIDGVYLLAGDLHAAHAIRADLYGPNGRDIPLWEFCSTPFEQNPSALTKYTYIPVRSAPLKNQKRLFTVHKHNFGLIRVDHAGPTTRVRFEVYGSQGELLASAGG